PKPSRRTLTLILRRRRDWLAIRHGAHRSSRQSRRTSTGFTVTGPASLIWKISSIASRADARRQDARALPMPVPASAPSPPAAPIGTAAVIVSRRTIVISWRRAVIDRRTSGINFFLATIVGTGCAACRCTAAGVERRLNRKAVLAVPRDRTPAVLAIRGVNPRAARNTAENLVGRCRPGAQVNVGDGISRCGVSTCCRRCDERAGAE